MADPQRTGRLNKSRSKDVEREWAKALGTTRETDGRGTRQADIFLGPWDIEIKSRLGLKGIMKLMDEAIGKARANQTPVLGLEVRTDPGFPNARYVVMRREDWIAWNCHAVGESDSSD